MDWFLYDNGLRHERVKETKCKLTGFNLYLYKLGVPWSVRKIKYKISNKQNSKNSHLETCSE